MNYTLYDTIKQGSLQRKKFFAALVDPDKFNEEKIKKIISLRPDFILVGGSLIQNTIEKTIENIKSLTKEIPIILFPGNYNQLSNQADAILFLSLISGRNPEFLIGQHVVAAPLLKQSSLEIIPTGYILIDGGKCTSVQYMSNTMPIPADKTDIIISTAIAGEMLGLKLIYLEAGSGTMTAISPNIIQAVRNTIDIPIIVGGGLRNREDVEKAWNAGADIVVVGSALE